MTRITDAEPRRANGAPKRRNLDSRWHAVLDGRHDYASDHAALSALASAAVNAGWSFAEWSAWVTEDSRRGLTRSYVLWETRKGREVPRSAHRRNGLLRRVWEKSEEFTRRSPAFTDEFAVRRWVEELRSLSMRDAWGGQAGNSDRLVLDALLDVAHEQRSTLVTIGVRNLSEATGVGRTTVSRALKRLAARGYLTVAQESRGEHAHRYRLTTPNRDLSGTPSLPDRGVDPRVPPVHLSRLDAFAPGALGRTAARVLAALDVSELLTAVEVAEFLGLTPRTVRRALDHLLAVGAVVRLPRDRKTSVWAARPVEEIDWDEVAEAYGTTGTADRRRAEHDRHREGWTVWLAAHPRATYQTAASSWAHRRRTALTDATRRGAERAARPPRHSHVERRSA